MPFREQDSGELPIVLDRVPAAELLELCACADSIWLVWRGANETEYVQTVQRNAGVVEEAIALKGDGSSRHWCSRETGLTAFVLHNGRLGYCAEAVRGQCEAQKTVSSSASTQLAVMDLQGDPAVLCVRAPDASDPAPLLTVMRNSLEPAGTRALHAASTSRRLLCVVPMSAQSVALFSTDREDELDLCLLGEPTTRTTISLGNGQRFETATGSRGRVFVVSRGERDVVVRTVASDMRTELNATPLVPRTGWFVEHVHCAVVQGAFCVVHTERHDHEVDAVVTFFQDGKHHSTRFASVPVHRVWVFGTTVLLAGMMGGFASPMLVVQEFVRMESRREEPNASKPLITGLRRYVYPLMRVHPESRESRHALLHDVSEVLALSLGAGSPRSREIVSDGETRDRLHFWVPLGAEQLVALSVLVRSDASAIVTVKMGAQTAPNARELSFLERMRQTFTGDDDNDPTTTRVETRDLFASLEEILRAIWGLRTSMGAW